MKFECQSNLKKLQIVPNEFLRIIGQYRRFASVSKMQQELGTEYLKDYIHKITVRVKFVCQKYCIRVKSIKHKRVMHLVQTSFL